MRVCGRPSAARVVLRAGRGRGRPRGCFRAFNADLAWTGTVHLGTAPVHDALDCPSAGRLMVRAVLRYASRAVKRPST